MKKLVITTECPVQIPPALQTPFILMVIQVTTIKWLWKFLLKMKKATIPELKPATFRYN